MFKTFNVFNILMFLTVRDLTAEEFAVVNAHIKFITDAFRDGAITDLESYLDVNMMFFEELLGFDLDDDL
jgi:hypothetical protein